MQNADIIRKGVEYIEQNLKTDITPEELANIRADSRRTAGGVYKQTPA